MFHIYRDRSRSRIKSCNPKNQMGFVPELVWYLNLSSVLYLPGLSRDFDCFDFILEWDGMSGMEVVFDSLIFLAVLIV